MFDPSAIAASLSPEQKERLLELFRARKLPRAAVDDSLNALRLLNPRKNLSDVSELNNWGWSVVLHITSN